MTKLFRIKQTDGSIVEQEPIINGWYVGMGWMDCSLGAQISEHDNTDEAGAIAQYVGDGEFYDDDSDTPIRMQDYDHIVFSHMPSARRAA
jgi:hypothetical protein